MAKKPVRKPAPAAKKKASKPSKSSKPKKPAKPSKPAAKKSAARPMSKAKPSAANKPAAKPAPAKRKAAPAKPAPAKTKAAPAAKPAPKPVPAPKAPAPKASAAKAPAPKAPAPAPVPVPKPLKGKDAVRAKILAQRAKPAKPAAFSLDEVLAIAKTAAKTAAPEPAATTPVIATKSGKVAPLPPSALKPAAPAKVKAASLADILGFNPRARASHAENEEHAIPEKFKRYYKLLIELRNHVTGQVDQHSEETLKRSAKEDSGDLSSYGTDGGTDSFDLSLIHI
jgi:hypothetical protein